MSTATPGVMPASVVPPGSSGRFVCVASQRVSLRFENKERAEQTGFVVVGL